jgi:uncharacterized protein (DUF849 family)
MNKLILNLTPTGMIPTREMTPHVPITPAEIAGDVASCVPFGVSMVHLHARDEAGIPTYHKSIYGDIIGRIREVHPDLVLVVSTSGRNFSEFTQRSDALDLEDGQKPDMASLTLSSMNFIGSASVNSPDIIQRLAAKMQEKGIKPELEVFDLGMVNYAHYLIRKGLLTPPYYFNIILGNIAGAQAELLHLGLIVSELPPDSIWSVGGIGAAQLGMNTLGVVHANGVRVGLEDNIFFREDRSVLASNATLLERVRKIADVFGRQIASPTEARKLLGLKP